MKKALLWGLGALGLTGLALALSGGSKKGPSGPLVPATTSLVLLGDPLSLKKGQYYRGRLDLKSGDLAPFRAEADEEELGKGLSALGFQDVRVFMSTSELPAGWPADGLLNPSGETRWFQAAWGQATAKMPRPDQMTMMWVTRTPDDARRA